jgi:hypothetical protein
MDDIPSFHIHHLIPKSKGGNDSYQNLIVLHERCHRLAHRKKYDKEYIVREIIDIITNSKLTESTLSEIRWGSGKYRLDGEAIRGSGPEDKPKDIIHMTSI